MPRPEGLVRGQRISHDQLTFARGLRKEMTAAEQVLWKALRTNQLEGFHFRRQQIIGHFVADFYCHAVGLVIEVDGPIHDDQIEADTLRDEYMAYRGLTILRIANDDVFQNLTTVLSRINTRLHELSNDPHQP